jgi:hypothetical protein
VAGSATPPLTDTATVTGGVTPTGTITFELFGPQTTTPSTCTAANLVFTSLAITLVPGPDGPTATSPAVSPAPALAGTYEWVASYTSDTPDNANASSLRGDEPIQVTPAQPAITTTTSPPGPVTVGTPLADSAAVTGGANPTRNVTFELFGPDNLGCTPGPGQPIFVQTVPVTAATVTFTPTSQTPAPPGVYSWVATYGGDGNNRAVASGCTAEQVTVVKATPSVTTTPSSATITVGTRSPTRPR